MLKIINKFLIDNLKIELHHGKSKIIMSDKGVNLLGYRVFYYHKLLRKRNRRKFGRSFNEKLKLFKNKGLSIENFTQSLQGWFGYATWADTYKLRNKTINYINRIKDS